MAALLKLTALIICINIFLYLGVNYALNSGGASDDYAVRFQGDLFDLLLEDKEGFDQYMDDYAESLESEDNITRAYKFQLSSNFSSMPNQYTGSSVSGESGAFSFLDAIKVVWAFIKTLINVGLSPLTLFTAFRMPPIISLILGVPLAILYFITLIFFIRGVSS